MSKRLRGARRGWRCSRWHSSPSLPCGYTHLSEFIDNPSADERVAATYNIVPNDTGLRIINPTGAFDLPWRHIASAVAQLNA